MTLEEVRNKIAESNDFNWFNSVQTNLNYPHLKFSISLTGMTAVYEFISKQVNGWSKKGENIPNELKSSRDFFQQIQTRLIELLNQKNQNIRENVWTDIKNQLESNKRYFIFESPEVDFLIKLFLELPNSFGAAYNFILGTVGNINNKQAFIGTLMAYEFQLKDSSEIADRKSTEKVSLSRIRNEFLTHLADVEKQTAEYFKTTNEQYSDYTRQLDNSKKEREDSFDNWFKSTKGSFESFDEQTSQKVKDLERTYEELLRLKKPAEYWNKRAEVLKKEGKRFLNWLIGLVLFGCVTLYLLLWLTPEGMLLSFIKGQASAIKWSIVYITFISLLAFGVKAVAKAMFSSFHLARDAEEREQLTYVYLALVKESAVDEKDKSLIMQSLFSRADTGLLKEDSSPAMPGVFADKVIHGK